MNIMPEDTYKVVNKSIITEYDKKVLNMLYLPVIGPYPVILYNMLILELDKSNLVSTENTHAHMLSSLRITSSELTEARNSLEAIGLLKTYYKEDTVNNYIYELYSPISASEFLSHPMLNMILYSNVGKIEYDKLVTYFKNIKIVKDGYTEITHTFNSVFKSIPRESSDIKSESIRKKNKLKLNLDSSFDIDFLIETMPSSIDKKIFTKDLKDLIISLAYLYEIDVMKMQKIIASCMNSSGTVDRVELRKVVRNHYQFDHDGLLPTVIEHTQPEHLRKKITDDSKLAKMIYTFETISPRDFLKSKHNGAELVKRDIELLEELIVDYKLKPGVVNVLIDYVLKTNDNKLVKSYVEAIAGQWSRSNIETVQEAMDIARRNHFNSKEKKKTKPITESNIPAWFDKENKKDTATDEEREAIEDLLKEYK